MARGTGLCHYGIRYGVRLYGTVRKYGVQPYLYGFFTVYTVKCGTAYGTVQTSKASVKKIELSFVSALQMAK